MFIEPRRGKHSEDGLAPAVKVRKARAPQAAATATAVGTADSIVAPELNEGALAARRLAGALAGSGGADASLDCEQGIMRALTEHQYAASNVPVELLREWTLIAVQRRDCGLLGRAMTLASASGHSMEHLLDSVGTLSSVLNDITTLFHGVRHQPILFPHARARVPHQLSCRVGLCWR